MHTHAHSISLSVHLCDAFFSSVFIFFPCIYFGASWPVSPVGADSAKVTGSSPMYICLGLGWGLKKVTFISFMIGILSVAVII